MSNASTLLRTLGAVCVLVLGLIAGYSGLGPSWSGQGKRAGAASAQVIQSSDAPRESRSSKPGDFPSVHAEAWEMLKDRNLPRGERLALQAELLRQWAEADLEAALHAILAETDVERLLPSCDASILAKPMEAWELACSKKLGWESARLRNHCLELLGNEDPSRLFGLFDQMTEGERLGAASAAMCFAIDHTSGDELDLSVLREEVRFKQILALGTRPDGDNILREAGAALGPYLETEELAAQYEGAGVTAERKLFLAAYAASQLSGLDVASICPPRSLEDLQTSRGLEQFPGELRAEIAAIALRNGEVSSEFILEFAKVAVEAGDLDSLKAASDAHAFVHESQAMDSPEQWADWALALPEDPRTIDTFGQVMLGAAYGDLEGTQPKIEALPPGQRRNLGFAALVYAVRSQLEVEEMDNAKITTLLKQISDPVLRGEVGKFYGR